MPANTRNHVTRTRLGSSYGRRWMVIGALAALLVLAAACEADEDPEDAGADVDGEVADDQCDPDDPVEVGALLSLTGPAADIGDRALEGTQMAADELNDEGGILGRCVEVLERDDEGDGTRASQMARELVDQEEVDFVVGPFLSTPVGASLEVTNPAGTLHIIGGVLPEGGDAEQFPYSFRTQVPAQLQAETFAGFMQEAGYESAAGIAVNNALGISVSEQLEELLPEEGLELTQVEFHESGDADHSSQMAALESTDPDVLIVMSTAVPDLIASLRAREDIGWDVPVLGFSSMAFPEVTEGVGEEGMEDVLAGQAFENLARDADGNVLGGERVEDWLERYLEWAGADEFQFGPQQVALFYDSVKMVAWAAEEVGSLDPDEIQAHLEANSYEGVAATYDYDEQRHDGVTLDDLVFVIAASLDPDGTYQVAPALD